MDLTYLVRVAKGALIDQHVSSEAAIQQLGALHQRDSIQELVALLEDPVAAEKACAQLAQMVDIFDAYYHVVDQYRRGNLWSAQLLKSWARESWLAQKPVLPNSIKAIVFQIPFCVTAGMLSPIKQAFSRSDMPLHAESLLCETMPDALLQIQTLKASGYPVAFAVRQIDTTKASVAHRKAATRALLWHSGALNTVERGIILSQHMDSDFYDLGESDGALLLTVDTRALTTGRVIQIQPYEEIISVVCEKKECLPFKTMRHHFRSVWRMGERIEWMLGSALTRQSKQCLEYKPSPVFHLVDTMHKHIDPHQGYTLTQKIIARACGIERMPTQTFCEPTISTIELSQRNGDHPSLAKRGYCTDLLLKGCNMDTDVYPSAPALKPSDGRSHAWLSRLLLPDRISLSDNPYTRYPLGITLSSNLVEMRWAALTGLLSITLFESLLVQFYGKKPPFIRLRDIINAIPYFGLNRAILEKPRNDSPKYSVEIQGLDDITVEEAYSLTEDSFSYHSAACTIALTEESTIQALSQNKEWLFRLIRDRYPKHTGLQRRLEAMTAWLAHPHLLKADSHAQYVNVLNINLNDIKEPLLASIEHLDVVLPLSEAAQQWTTVDVVWIGSTAVDLNHYRVVATLLQKHRSHLKARLFVALPSKWALQQLMQEGCYRVYGRAGVYTQMPDNASCPQTYFRNGSKVIVTSQRAFFNSTQPKWSGYVASPELAVIAALLGRLPSLDEYQHFL